MVILRLCKLAVAAAASLVASLAACLAAACALYVIAALVLGAIPADRGFAEASGGTEIFVCSNGVHTDFVLPVKTIDADWTAVFPPEDFRAPIAGYDHIGIGWGDLAFYRETPHWRDLRFATAWRALLGRGPSAIHAEYRPAPVPGEKCAGLAVDAQHYVELRDYITGNLAARDPGMPAERVADGYGARDAFFLAQGHFSPLMTCNAWINRGLKAAGLPSGIWAPFEFLVLHHLR
jgi:uncharacterized protein (TIGR02117 family)